MKARELKNIIKRIEDPTPIKVLEEIAKQIFLDFHSRFDGRAETMRTLIRMGRRVYKSKK
jgi:hypothetical protein